MLPAALPQILTGLQVALPIALIVAIVAEMLMGGYGLGGAMIDGLALRRLARRVRRHRRDRDRRLCAWSRRMAMLRRRLLIWHQEALEPTTV